MRIYSHREPLFIRTNLKFSSTYPYKAEFNIVNYIKPLPGQPAGSSLIVHKSNTKLYAEAVIIIPLIFLYLLFNSCGNFVYSDLNVRMFATKLAEIRSAILKGSKMEWLR
jgi:hypothetical protein